MKNYTDFLNEEKNIDTVAKIAGEKSLMGMGGDLENAFGKKNVSFSLSPMAHYRIKVGGKTLIVVNKRYAEEAEKEVGELAIGYQGKI